MERLLHNPGGIVRGTVVHHNDLIGPVVERQQGPDGGLNSHALVMGRYNDGDRDIVIPRQFIFQQIAPLRAVQGGGTHRNGQKEKAGIPHHVAHKEPAGDIQERLEDLSHEVASRLSWVILRSSR